MKRLLALVICSIILLTGCSNENLESVEIENTVFDLVSDKDTGIVYIRNYTYCSYYVYTPYYSENGRLCKFDDGVMKEVEE